ncbi:TetR/AcrR family transcriptional regulator [Pseudonocardia humida]|uniref:TetR/AcrR family transcriptional regulator n=1 Tax=Pseudonocardia humida TaxID=2800819 RepID=A0ABT1AAI8_9PSEU|nr:TetR/AcrR family transcriptional regulator [Pseudonocardia humida]MCO1660062.1 TetR/AcrR family transcriptional regulator [Pseudonocardia humida]
MGTDDRAPGRPRSKEADAAILGAALELLIERGAEATSIEQVARRAGVTRATVYRRFPDKTRLLIATVEAAYGNPPQSPEIRDVEQLVAGWVLVLTDPRQRRLLRRLYGAIEDNPELARAYHDQFGRHRDQARRDVLERARDRGRLPVDSDPDILLDVLTGAVWQHLAVRPDTSTAGEVERFLRAVLHQIGYRPDADRRQPVEGSQ